ncbi:MAG: M67 family metallopeptidase [Nitrospirae bacterium]|nr:M67 family metallopeptidase [Nitrospirota bacterium]
MRKSITINGDTLKRIYSHAVESYPNECCGIITGKTADADVQAGQKAQTGHVGMQAGKEQEQTVHPCRNIQDELHASDPVKYPRTARVAYAMNRDEAEEIFKSAKRSGESVVAFYHSHPEHDAYFSEEDKEAQTVFGEPEFPEALQVVISVKLGMINGIKYFRWNGSSGDFEEAGDSTDA